MAYRSDNNPARLWRQWKLKNKAKLDACGLPEAVWQSQEAWWNYLEHGYYDYFKTEDLSEPQMRAMYELLKSELSDQEKQSNGVWLQLKSLLNRP